ncbi:MAG: hypothetical protein ACXWQR_19925 [Ktedonobacterales bacterium]
MLDYTLPLQEECAWDALLAQADEADDGAAIPLHFELQLAGVA